MWDLWCFGDASTLIRPYTHINRSSLSVEKKSRKVKKVISFTTKEAIEKGLVQARQKITDQSLSPNIFNQTYPILIRKAYGEKH